MLSDPETGFRTRQRRTHTGCKPERARPRGNVQEYWHHHIPTLDLSFKNNCLHSRPFAPEGAAGDKFFRQSTNVCWNFYLGQ
jgi:hypothetical protein